MNLLYSLFFFVVDFAIYAVLTKAYKINRLALGTIAGFVLIFSILHLSPFNFSRLMSSADYWSILMFSFGLIILHFGGLLQVKGFKRAEFLFDRPNKSLPKLALKVFDLMRLKVIYGMIFLYQLLAVWIPEIR